MAQPKTIVVFGATSQIGSAVASRLAKSPQFSVRGVTREASSPKAMSLKASGIDVVQIDYTDSNAVNSVLNGAHGCFVLTHSDLTRSDSKHLEIRQGETIADACQRQRVAHVVCSTYVNVSESNGLPVRHMDAKADVFRCMQEMRLPLTGLLLPVLYEDLLKAPLCPSLIGGVYQIGIPIGTRSLEMIAAQDIGEVVIEMFSNNRHWIGKSLNAIGDKRTVNEIAAVFSSFVQPLRFIDQQLTTNEFRRVHQDMPGVNDYANQFDFYMRMNQRSSLDTMKRIVPNLQDLCEWTQRNSSAIYQALGASQSAASTPGSVVYM